MAFTIQTGIPVAPRVVRAAVAKPLEGLSADLAATYPTMSIGDSILVPGEFRAVALRAGVLAKRQAKITKAPFSVRCAREGEAVRIWRIEPVVKAPKVDAPAAE